MTPTQSAALKKAAKVAGWTALGLGALAASNALLFIKAPPLQSDLHSGETRYFQTPFGDLFYKKAGSGPPLVLIHGIGAGCSSFEFRNVWEELAQNFTVYAVDLLGFGKSDKPNIAYSSDLFIDVLGDFIHQSVRKNDASQKVSVVGSSLGAAYVVALAERHPDWFDRFVLVCPTGITSLASAPTEISQMMQPLLRTPVLGATLYNCVTSHVGIQQYLARRIYAKPESATWEIAKHYHVSAHQPGGPNALAYFVTGQLNANIRDAFAHLAAPVLLVWGDAPDVETPQSDATAFLQTNSDARLIVVADAGMLPHEEQPADFLTAILPFLQATAA